MVVTGASSGMGRAAALRLAARGDRVVVSARRARLLDEVVRACEDAGGEALAAPADVTDEAAVQEVAQQAVARFGRVDAWVHAAAVAAFGRFEEVPVHAARRLLEVNLTGSAIVAREALLRFKAQGEGHLVLVASVLGKAPIPYLSLYNASKYGVVGLAQSIRSELKMDALDARIHVSTLLPPATDTPFYVHAANYSGQVPKPPPPTYSVDTLAEAIVDLLDGPREEVAVGAAGKLVVTSHAAAPGVYDRAVGPYSRTMFLEEPQAPHDGALFEPMREGARPGGGWKREAR